MIPYKIIRFIAVTLISCSVLHCTREEIVLHGDINGIVIDSETQEPLNLAQVIVKTRDEGIKFCDTVVTTVYGTYLFTNLSQGSYQLRVIKEGYSTDPEYIYVTPGSTNHINFEMYPAPIPAFSKKNLDFGLDSSSLILDISNSGKVKMPFVINPSQEWIRTDPSSGTVTDETDRISVTIDRSGLPDDKLKEFIEIITITGNEVVRDTIGVLVNGILDCDANFYKITRIGTQTWMAENLMTTKYNDSTGIPYVFDNTEWSDRVSPGYCWYDNLRNKYADPYGALYNWYTVQTGKLCPSGWHVPSTSEWLELDMFLGVSTAGCKLKETGFTHWSSPNVCATNETGFSAVGAGYRIGYDGSFIELTVLNMLWSATGFDADYAYSWLLSYDNNHLMENYAYGKKIGMSIRCVKDEGPK